MSKRGSEDKIKHSRLKIKKICRRRIVYSSSSSDSEENFENGTRMPDADALQNDSLSPVRSLTPQPLTSRAAPPPSPFAPLSPLVPDENDPGRSNRELSPELDPELLKALGDASDDEVGYGPDIHKKLAQRWLPILRKGLQSEVKDKLLKEYSVPENCKLLKAPTLNPEIAAALADFAKGRDKKMQAKQDQLGLGITAMNRAMSLLLTGDDKVQALKILSDSCRILTDLHFTESQVRTKLITPGLDKSILTVLQGHIRDETLFGNTLSEKIKASKAIEKQGLQIKRPPPPRASTSNAPATLVARPRYQGNWSGPPRYQQSSRGGRTISYRNQFRRAPAGFQAIPPPLPSNRQSTSTAPAANKRAPTQH